MAEILAQKTFTVKKLVNGKTLTFVLKTDKALKFFRATARHTRPTMRHRRLP